MSDPGSWVRYLAIIMYKRKRRRYKRLLVAGGVLVVAFLAFSAVLFVWPRTNAPRKVDAIVVLGGADANLTKGLKLASEGYAPTLLISTPDPSACGYSVPGSRSSAFSHHPRPHRERHVTSPSSRPEGIGARSWWSPGWPRRYAPACDSNAVTTARRCSTRQVQSLSPMSSTSGAPWPRH